MTSQIKVDNITSYTADSKTKIGRFNRTWRTITADGSTGFTAKIGENIFVDTSGGTVTITLPASPVKGDEINFVDASGTFDTNALTLDRNGNNILGSAANLTVSTERAGFGLVYFDASNGWVYTQK